MAGRASGRHLIQPMAESPPRHRFSLFHCEPVVCISDTAQFKESTLPFFANLIHRTPKRAPVANLLMWPVHCRNSIVAQNNNSALPRHGARRPPGPTSGRNTADRLEGSGACCRACCRACCWCRSQQARRLSSLRGWWSR